MDEWTDDRVDLTELWGEPDRLLDGIAGPTGPEAQIFALQEELLTALPELSPIDARVRSALDALEESGGRLGVAELAERVGVSRQHLTRKVREVCGIGPKRLGRIVRLRRLLDGVPASGPRSWADAAAAAGYYDQAHLISDFRELVGTTPARYFAELPGPSG